MMAVTSFRAGEDRELTSVVNPRDLFVAIHPQVGLVLLT